MKALVLSSMLILMLGACASGGNRAPVEYADGDLVLPELNKSKGDNADWRPEEYVVQKGDTLYNIAFNFGLDYREIALNNQIEDPNVIKIGQRLQILNRKVEKEAVAKQTEAVASVEVEIKPLERQSSVEIGSLEAGALENESGPVVISKLKTWPKLVKYSYSDGAIAKIKQASERPAVLVASAPKEEPVAAPVAKVEVKEPIEPPKAVVINAKPVESKPVEAVANVTKPEVSVVSVKTRSIDDGAGGKIEWSMPTNGKIITRFSESTNQKGVDIAGKVGQPVLAAASGKVVYSGNGLRGYGNLLIVKHNGVYISAYAHNDKILVKEGDVVKRGQKIAEMGRSDADRDKLHFEVRRYGRPIDPVKYLPLESS